MELFKITKSKSLLFFALISISQTGASEFSCFELTPSEKETVEKLLTSTFHDEKPSDFKIRVEQATGDCSVYKLVACEISDALDAYESGNHPQDEDTIAPLISSAKSLGSIGKGAKRLRQADPDFNQPRLLLSTLGSRSSKA